MEENNTQHIVWHDDVIIKQLISNRSFEDDDKNIPTWKTAAQEGAKINAQLQL